MRTYLPTLKKVLSFLCTYITKHRDVMLKVIGTENEAALDAVITACNILMPILDEFIPTPT